MTRQNSIDQSITEEATVPRANTADRRLPSWPLYLIAAPAAVAVWSGWVGLGGLCGFGIIHPLPGIADGFHLNTAITLPVGVEAYGAYALRAWLTPGITPLARKFAARSAIGSLGLGMAGQVIYHLLAAAHALRAPWPVLTIVSCLPVVALALGTALAHLLRQPAEPMVSGEATSQPLAREDGTPQAAPMAREVAPTDGTPQATPQATGTPSGEPPGEPRGEPPSKPLDEPAGVPSDPPSGEPRDEPPRRPARPAAPRPAMPKDADSRRARKLYRESAEAVARGERDKPLSDRALAAEFPGRGRTWAANRIAEAQEGPQAVAGAVSS